MLISITPTKIPPWDGNLHPRTILNQSVFPTGTKVLAPGTISPSRVINNSVFPAGNKVQAGAAPGEIRPAVFTNISTFPTGVPSSGETRLVAVANSGADASTRATSSTDLSSWTGPDTTPVFSGGSGVSWESLAYSPSLGLWVGLGQGVSEPQHLIMTSPDGHTWTQRTSAAAGLWSAVIWVAALNLFVAVGPGGLAQTSPDGITWTLRTASEANDWRALAYSPSLGLIVAVASNGTHRVMTSPDGINWTNRTAAAAQFWVGVAWSDTLNKFCAVANNLGSQIMHSVDGINWTVPAYSGISSFIWERIIWAAAPFSKFVICSANGAAIARSADGTTWSQVASINTNQQIEDVIWHSALELLVYCARTGTGNRIQSSPDGVTFTNLNAPDRDYRALGLSVYNAGSGNQVIVAPAPGQIRPTTFNNTSSFPAGNTVSVAPAPGNIRPSIFSNASSFPAGNTVAFRAIYGETITAYTNDLGKGNRQGKITVTHRAGLFTHKNSSAFIAGDENVIIDGAEGGDNIRFAAGITDGWIKFNFTTLFAQSRVIDAFLFWATTDVSNGTWQWYGANTDLVFSDPGWVALGAAFTLFGGNGTPNTSAEHLQPAANTTGYLHYMLKQTGGSTAVVFFREIEFKIRAIAP
jgi:hypothetical protein